MVTPTPRPPFMKSLFIFFVHFSCLYMLAPSGALVFILLNAIFSPEAHLNEKIFNTKLKTNLVKILNLYFGIQYNWGT